MAYLENLASGDYVPQVKTPVVTYTVPQRVVQEEGDSYSKIKKPTAATPTYQPPSNQGATNFFANLAAVLGGGQRYPDRILNRVQNQPNQYVAQAGTPTGFQRMGGVAPTYQWKLVAPENYGTPRATPNMYGAYGNMPQMNPDGRSSYSPYGNFLNQKDQYKGYGAYSYMPPWMDEQVSQDARVRLERQRIESQRPKPAYLWGRQGRDAQESAEPYTKPAGKVNWPVEFVPLDDLKPPPTQPYSYYRYPYWGYGGGGGGGWGGYGGGGYGGYGGTSAWLQGLMNWNI